MGRTAAKLVSIVLTALAVVGCTKDSNPSGPATTAETTSAIVGKWTVLSGGGTRKHLVFKSNNAYAFLDEYPYGMRSMEQGIYQAINGTIDLGNTQSPSLYAFSITSDTLILFTPDVSVLCYRNTAAPTDTQWARPVSILTTYPAPITSATDISVKDSILWYGNTYESSHLFKINLSTGAVDTTVDVSVSAWAVEWAGTSLYCGNDGYDAIIKVNPTTGAVLSQSKPMGAWIYGIAWDGAKLWCSSNNEQALYRYNPTSDLVEQTYKINVQPAGMDYAGGFLYVVIDGIINKCTPSPLTVVGAYRIPGRRVFGIAHDATSFLVSTQQEGSPAQIHRALLP